MHLDRPAWLAVFAFFVSPFISPIRLRTRRPARSRKESGQSFCHDGISISKLQEAEEGRRYPGVLHANSELDNNNALRWLASVRHGRQPDAAAKADQKAET